MTRVITFGTFDIFHVGHLALLERCKALGDHLSVGVSTDELNEAKKGRKPIYALDERVRILAALRVVDTVFIEASLEAKRDYVLEHRADILVMGDDWSGRFDHLSPVCRVVYLPRTPSISTSATIEKIKR
jgi:glycerol-3-phosphate cytidylyltransferase